MPVEYGSLRTIGMVSMNTLVIRIHQTNDVTTRWAPPPDVILQGMQEAVLRQPRHDL